MLVEWRPIRHGVADSAVPGGVATAAATEAGDVNRLSAGLDMAELLTGRIGSSSHLGSGIWLLGHYTTTA